MGPHFVRMILSQSPAWLGSSWGGLVATTLVKDVWKQEAGAGAQSDLGFFPDALRAANMMGSKVGARA